MLVDHRIGVIGDVDVRERLVVAQQHVVARLELLDQVLFEQQCFRFRPRRQKHHRRGFRDHPRNAPRMSRRARIVRHPRPQVARLADIEHARLGIEHPVDTRTGVQRLEIALDAGVTCRALGVGFGGHISIGCLSGMALRFYPRRCMIAQAGATVKASTHSVDNSAEKFWMSANFLCFPAPSQICLKFKHENKSLISLIIFLNTRQVTENVKPFVTLS